MVVEGRIWMVTAAALIAKAQPSSAFAAKLQGALKSES